MINELDLPIGALCDKAELIKMATPRNAKGHGIKIILQENNTGSSKYKIEAIYRNVSIFQPLGSSEPCDLIVVVQIEDK